MSAFMRPPAVVSAFMRAVNCGDLEALIDTFGWDAVVNANSVFYSGHENIRKWARRNLIKHQVTLEVDDISEVYGTMIISATADGNFDRDYCPDPLCLDFFFNVRNEKIVLMIAIKNIEKSGKIILLPKTTI